MIELQQDLAVMAEVASKRSLISGFDREIEAVLFHLAPYQKAQELLDDGLVDAIEEVRP